MLQLGERTTDVQGCHRTSFEINVLTRCYVDHLVQFDPCNIEFLFQDLKLTDSFKNGTALLECFEAWDCARRFTALNVCDDIVSFANVASNLTAQTLSGVSAPESFFRTAYKVE